LAARSLRKTVRSLHVSSARLNIVLFQPEIPQNTGNIGRTCVAVGAKLWIVRPAAFRLDDRHLRRSGLDYWQHLDWEDVASSDLLQERWSSDRTFFLTKRATQLYTQVAYRPGDYLVFGSETSGLPDQLLDAYPDRCLRIPMHDRVRSLNLSNAVAIVAYEAVRQWQLADIRNAVDERVGS
jgi:tRNA (cytidine/uridine-2'-O-)-methyltransferase